jgi:segregation and condensation protein A
LILKEEIDVCEVSLAEVVAAYLEVLLDSDQTDWDGLSEFLVLISALLELKSRLLLPQQTAEEELDPATAGELLVERLLRYQTFKAASLGLQERLAANAGRVLRPGDPPARPPAPVQSPPGSHDPLVLTEALNRLAEARRGPDSSHISPARIDLRRQIGAIRDLLRHRGRFSFEESFGAEEHMTQAVSLFAVLELMGEGTIRASQNRPFGDITVMRREARRIA